MRWIPESKNKGDPFFYDRIVYVSIGDTNFKDKKYTMPNITILSREA